ncbi:MAG: hypothetical protein IPH96_04570 [Saprospiraceae bacterium]|nr:hypothetical protein [Saprospiraceae bacterium]
MKFLKRKSHLSNQIGNTSEQGTDRSLVKVMNNTGEGTALENPYIEEEPVSRKAKYK